MDSNQILQRLNELRKRKIRLIAVSNSEWYSLFKDEIRNSIAIEGVFANRKELLDVLDRHKRTSDEKTAAILGYFEAASTLYEYANNLYMEGEFSIRVSDIRQTHTLLMRYEKQAGIYKGDLGEYRKETVVVARSAFTPLDNQYIRDFMQVYVKWINKKIDDPGYDKIKLAALSHILFETVHPFRDGNGRAGRILLSFILIGCGFINITIKGTQQHERDKYYSAMEEGDDAFEEMLREIENGRKITTELIDTYAEQSHTDKLEGLLTRGLRESLQRLTKTEYIPHDPDAVLPLRDAARFYNYSQDYLRNLINKGKLPGIRRGKLWYVWVRDLEQYIKDVESNHG